MRAILKQEEYSPLPLAEQVALLLAVAEGHLDSLPFEDVARFRALLAQRLPKERPRAAAEINETNQLSKDTRNALLELVMSCAADLKPADAESEG